MKIVCLTYHCSTSLVFVIYCNRIRHTVEPHR